MVQDRLRVGIILSTTRPSRFAERPAQWLMDVASRRADFDIEIVDLNAFPMPFFEDENSPAWKAPVNEAARRWGEKVDTFDGYVFVTAEYNHSIPAALKNALDYAYNEFVRKPAAFVGYGGVGAARAVEHLRTILVELQMAPLKHAVHMNAGEYLAIAREGKMFSDFPHLESAAELMLDQLGRWAKTLKRGRADSA